MPKRGLDEQLRSNHHPTGQVLVMGDNRDVSLDSRLIRIRTR